MFTAFAAAPEDDELIVIGTALGEVKCFRHVVEANGTAAKTYLNELEDMAIWESYVTSFPISFLLFHGVFVLVGDGHGAVVLLQLDTGLEIRRFQMEAAIVTGVWHDGVFVVADLVGNLIGVNAFETKWSCRTDILLQEQAASGTYIASIASIRLIDCEGQLCSYVATSLGRNELILTLRGHVVARLPTPTSFTSIYSESTNDPVVLCGGKNGVVYKLVTEAPSPDRPFTVKFEPVIETGFPVNRVTASNGRLGHWICSGSHSREVLEFDAKCNRTRHISLQAEPSDLMSAQGHIFVLEEASIRILELIAV
ncbi:hypothetical protein AeNC1_012000 [Aphanomyces euteiches]|nr:hypothetical protein AeNC1_012000 [Aphanomyces euteiches]